MTSSEVGFSAIIYCIFIAVTLANWLFFKLSVRNYRSTQVKLEMADRLSTEAYFIPETVPAYSAREVFAGLSKQPEKEATLNPTNPRAQADQFETEITQQFCMYS